MQPLDQGAGYAQLVQQTHPPSHVQLDGHVEFVPDPAGATAVYAPTAMEAGMMNQHHAAMALATMQAGQVYGDQKLVVPVPAAKRAKRRGFFTAQSRHVISQQLMRTVRPDQLVRTRLGPYYFAPNMVAVQPLRPQHPRIILRRHEPIPVHMQSRNSTDAAQPKRKREEVSYKRRDKSLSLLCENFIEQFSQGEFRDPDVGISLDFAAEQLGVERRRIYDIINILESVSFVGRKCKNTYVWHGDARLHHVLAELQDEAIKLWPEDARDAGLITQLPPATERHRLTQKQKREKSLGRFSQRFIQLFLVGGSTMWLSDAAEKLMQLGSDEGGTHMKTKIRRLYDIANVLTSVGLLEKVVTSDSRKPMFRWQAVPPLQLRQQYLSGAASAASASSDQQQQEQQQQLAMADAERFWQHPLGGQAGVMPVGTMSMVGGSFAPSSLADAIVTTSLGPASVPHTTMTTGVYTTSALSTQASAAHMQPTSAFMTPVISQPTLSHDRSASSMGSGASMPLQQMIATPATAYVQAQQGMQQQQQQFVNGYGHSEQPTSFSMTATSQLVFHHDQSALPQQSQPQLQPIAPAPPTYHDHMLAGLNGNGSQPVPNLSDAPTDPFDAQHMFNHAVDAAGGSAHQLQHTAGEALPAHATIEDVAEFYSMQPSEAFHQQPPQQQHQHQHQQHPAQQQHQHQQHQSDQNHFQPTSEGISLTNGAQHHSQQHAGFVQVASSQPMMQFTQAGMQQHAPVMQSTQPLQPQPAFHTAPVLQPSQAMFQQQPHQQQQPGAQQSQPSMVQPPMQPMQPLVQQVPLQSQPQQFFQPADWSQAGQQAIQQQPQIQPIVVTPQQIASQVPIQQLQLPPEALQGNGATHMVVAVIPSYVVVPQQAAQSVQNGIMDGSINLPPGSVIVSDAVPVQVSQRVFQSSAMSFAPQSQPQPQAQSQVQVQPQQLQQLAQQQMMQQQFAQPSPPQHHSQQQQQQQQQPIGDGVQPSPSPMPSIPGWSDAGSALPQDQTSAGRSSDHSEEPLL